MEAAGWRQQDRGSRMEDMDLIEQIELTPCIEGVN